MALHKKKRYKATSLKMHANDGRVWKVIICIAVGMAVSLAVFFTGLHLNTNLPDNTGDGVETTAPETEDNSKPTFQFKDVREAIAADKKLLSTLPTEQNAVDTVTVSVSNKDGKLRYRSAALSILAGAEAQKELPSLEALVVAESVEGKRVSLCYTPFSLEENTSLALNCIRLVLGEMCTFGADEIIIDARALTRTQIEVIASVLPNRDSTQIGLLLPADVLEEKNAEYLIRNYYGLYDLLSLDLSHLPLNASESTEETGDSTETGEVAETVTIEGFLKKNQLIIAKYSIRIHTACENAQDAESVIALAELYAACGVSLTSK